MNTCCECQADSQTRGPVAHSFRGVASDPIRGGGKSSKARCPDGPAMKSLLLGRRFTRVAVVFVGGVLRRVRLELPRLLKLDPCMCFISPREDTLEPKMLIRQRRDRQANTDVAANTCRTARKREVTRVVEMSRGTFRPLCHCGTSTPPLSPQQCDLTARP
ncbi:hypothetical protein ACOMHN_041285 [Nucella lapillus]